LKIHHYILLGVLVLCAGFGACWLVTALSMNDSSDDSASEAAEDSALGVGRQVERTDSEAAESASQLRFLEFGSSGGSNGREFDEGLGEPTQPARTVPDAQLQLPEGAGRIVFEVQDGSGRPIDGVSVSLRSLEPAGGVGDAVTGGRGEARFVDLAAGRYAYRVQAPGQSGRESNVSIALEDGERKRIAVRLADSNLSIAGRVRNESGEPIPGIAVSAVRHRFASATSEAVSVNQSTRSARTDADGAFTIRGLAEGEYVVRTSATDRYAPLKVTVQAGADSVVLVLVDALRVYGTVTDSDGVPLAHVWVGLLANRNRFTNTDDNGTYQFQLNLRSDDLDSTVRFYLSGYEEELLELRAAAAASGWSLRLDAQLRPVEDAARVSGVVETERGEPIARATIVFGSSELGAHYQSVSDADGNFSIPNVKIGPGYQLRVLPDGSFLDYLRQQIRVPEDGLSLEIVLESLAMGRLTGRMIDADGGPVPGFRLWLASSTAQRSAVPITSDERGYFELAEAPAGSLTFDTRASPRLAVRGAFLPDGGETEVMLVLDWGDRVLAGRVLDDRGDPVGGAQLSFSWSDTQGEMQSTSSRATQTDPAGFFRFTQLGPGEHLLDVRASGYHALKEYHDVGSDSAEVEVRLEPNEP
jgi:protocatechuate 3,4-dioxygenase beta subunit